MFRLRPPNPSDDPRFVESQRWYDAFEPKPTGHGDLILDQARRKYAEQSAAYERLDDKADSLLRFAGTIAALLVTAIAGWRLHPAGLVIPSLSCFLVAMLLALVARIPFLRPVMTPARNMIDGVPQTKAPQEWIAAGLFLVTEELSVLSEWKGKMVLYATIFLCCGVVLSAALIFTFPA
jgi:hypothetical protein